VTCSSTPLEHGFEIQRLEHLERRNEKLDLTEPDGIRGDKVAGVSSFAVSRLATGAELRVRGPDGADAVICVNGGQRAQVEGTWSASLEWLVSRLAPRHPALRFAEVRYRVKSWERLDWCIEDARAALYELAAGRALLVGFSMGGAVAAAIAGEDSVVAVLGLAPWFPERLPLDALRGKRLHVLHGRLDRALPGVPGVSVEHSRRGFERALAVGAHAEYTVIPGGVHGLAVRTPWGATIPLPRASRWSELADVEVERFASSV
jgi:pimeloyl-ACP methyl ester carboxylesterase